MRKVRNKPPGIVLACPKCGNGNYLTKRRTATHVEVVACPCGWKRRK